MKSLKFFSFYLSNPYRIIQQISYKRFLKNNPGVPWMAPNVITFLDSVITKDFEILEWGSGGSTKWFAKRCKKITSVENNDQWYQKVNQELKEDNLNNVSYLHVETDEGLDQGRILSGQGELPEYVKVVHNFKENQLDLVIVDGSFRHLCIEQAPNFIKPGGYLLLDNSNWCTHEDWGIPEGWSIVSHHDIGVSCTTVWQKPKSH